MTSHAFGLRRVVVSFLVALLGALAVFTLPRIIYNSVRPAAAQQVAPQGAAAAPAPAVAAAQEPAVPAPAPRRIGLAERSVGLLGIVVILAAGWAMSHNRKAIRWRVVAIGVLLQLLFGVFVLRVPFGQALFRRLGQIVTTVLGYSYAGSSFVFGEIGKQNSSLGVVFAFQILPAIIFVSALFAILYYLGIMQAVVRGMALVMNKLMYASGAESTNVAASIFMGQTEAPLTIRPFLPTMTRSELMTVMTAGMAHVSGAIMAAYIAFGVEARHLLTAVIMTAPGTILMAKILEPETEKPDTMGNVELEVPKPDVNVVDAASRGTGEGLHLMLNVIAMLISFIAMVALVNGLFGWVHGRVAWFPSEPPDRPRMDRPTDRLVIGVSWKDTGTIGALIGERAVLNEFIAFADLGRIKATLDPRSFTIASYALCRLREHQLGRHPDRRHRGARAGPQARPRAARLPRDDGGHAGQPDVGDDRRTASVVGPMLGRERC